MRSPFARYEDHSPPAVEKKADWLSEFARSLSGNAQVMNAVKTQSLHNQIQNILGSKSKHATVESIVNEYQELTGLKKYLAMVQDQQVKTASTIDEILPRVNPNLKTKILQFIDNRVETFKGYVAGLAIQEEVLNNFKGEGLEPSDVYEKDFSKYIAELLQKEQAKHPSTENYSQLGKNVGAETDQGEEDGNTDFFYHMNPKS